MKLDELESLNIGEVNYNVSLRNYTSYRLNTIARAMVSPYDIDRLKDLIDYLRVNNIKYKVIGNGSNLIFVNDIYDGVIIRLDKLNYARIMDNEFVASAGYSLMKFANDASRMGYSGLEFATGIPGSVGGSLFMNAGAYNSSMSNVVSKARVLTNIGEIKNMSNDELEFGYRSSFLQRHKDFICLEVTFNLTCGNKEEIVELIDDRRIRRINSQPLEFPSAGSVFRNPPNDFAGRLIEGIGYKGMRLGGAMVSSKHANFIVNTGNATGTDIINLIDDIKKKVYEKFEVELLLEQEIVE